ncbi:sulfotransferase family 2 domain-containing protein [Winogradskyella wichelsiae]|uniref:sulfotransferase family 2 domain-containing protein n=1 Tax=Winogradskyella wichelsiae TaxID=2697007 RepID=UPI0015CB04CF|nr:sulfotransferase family 2 domain-containing protein [Winogradskyella wichelsiae]
MKPFIFLHIPKNGGTTLHSIIEKNYNSQEVFSIKVVNEKSTEPEFKALPNKDAISVLKGHMTYGLHNNFSKQMKYVTLLRNPIDRISSYYHFVKALPHNRHYDRIHSNNLSLREFVESTPDGEFNNGQTHLIAGDHGNGDYVLQLALENIKNEFLFVGLVEQYDESLILLKQTLDWPEMPAYRIKNNGKKKKLLSEEDIDIIKKYNALDFKLYETIQTEFEKLVKSEVNASDLSLLNRKKKLMDFKFALDYKIRQPIYNLFKP